jgi:hypothetical protein
LYESANNSPYLTGLLNAFAENKGSFVAGVSNGGTYTSNNVITIDPAQLPSGNLTDIAASFFATHVIGHEDAHAVIPGGAVDPYNSINDAIYYGARAEGVAAVSEYITSVQTGAPFVFPGKA